ncbi:hypothetical protein [Streptomyces cirratus]|uniref:hypothetical protein n=1 Tax=Streptomyces cirratus TaxID=68187 RepID=UPI00361D1C63
MTRIGIVSTGSYLPDTVVGNEEIARGAGVSDEWIVRKTGIRERRRADDRDATSDLAARAALAALEQAGCSRRTSRTSCSRPPRPTIRSPRPRASCSTSSVR